MVRRKSVEKYEKEVREGLTELFDLCRCKLSHVGDLLLCQQNGFIVFGDKPCVGLGEEGLNNMQIMNSISVKGIGGISDDNNYFAKNGNKFHKGVSDFEKGIFNQKHTYLNIWENGYFLRVFTQVVNILNGVDYDWYLDIGKLRFNEKSKHIREQIIKRLNTSPLFQDVVKIAYVGQIRNAIAHSQYHCVQGGIFYDNFNSSRHATLQGLTFEDWEKKYIYSFFIFVGLFQILKQIVEDLYLPMSKTTLSKGVPIKASINKNKWYETYLYPNEKGDIWRFSKV